jgi:malonyl-CoA O-methyltransferase
VGTATVKATQAAVRPVDPKALGRWRWRLRQSGAPWLHAEIARRMTDRLTLVLRQPDVVIDWEAATGGGEKVLAGVYPQARRVPVEWDAVAMADSSERSDAAIAARPVSERGTQPDSWRHRLASWWHKASGMDVPTHSQTPAALTPDAVPAGEAGLVWANMVLHAHADPLAVMRHWHRMLGVDGFLMFSVFGPGSLPELRRIYGQEGWGPPMASMVDMHDLGDLLVQAGFADPVMDQETIVLTWPSGQAALAELRSLGINAATGRCAGLRTPRWRQSLIEHLEKDALGREDGRVALTFEVAYGHAFKPLPRVAVQSEVSVDLQAMREMLAGSSGASGASGG